MRKNLYDSDKLIIIIHEEQHRYQAKFIGKCLSFSKDVCVPVPRYEHFHLFEHDMMPAMWNKWFIEEDNHVWLDYGWRDNLDFAQKQGYLNTYRTEQVDTMLESNLFGIMTIRVDKVSQEAITEMCLIFPRARIVALTTNRKIKVPFGLNTYKQVNPESISPVETSWQHGMEQWISNRQMAIKAISQDLGLSLIQSELYAMFNKAGEHLPGYKSSGHWGRWHLLRMTLVPDEMAMIKLEVDGMTLMQEKIKQEKEYYQEIISSSEITTIKITQFNQSHSTMYNPVHLTRFEINDQSMLDAGVFYAQPPMQIRGKYLAKDLMPIQSTEIKCDGYWEIKTNGVNILT